MARRATTEVSPSRAFSKTIESLGRSHPTWRVFADFVEMSAIALSNAMLLDPTRETRYLEIVKRYTREELDQLCGLLAHVMMGLNWKTDFLGGQFSALGLSSHWTGQFFTPMPVARAMAEMTLGGREEIARTLGEKGFLTLHEPAVGAGAMVIACAAAMRDAGFDPQRQLHVTAIDVDPTAVHMAYVQLSLLQIPAAIIIGDTLRMVLRECWYTPAHHLGFWDAKLKRRA